MKAPMWAGGAALAVALLLLFPLFSADEVQVAETTTSVTTAWSLPAVPTTVETEIFTAISIVATTIPETDEYVEYVGSTDEEFEYAESIRMYSQDKPIDWTITYSNDQLVTLGYYWCVDPGYTPIAVESATDYDILEFAMKAAKSLCP